MYLSPRTAVHGVLRCSVAVLLTLRRFSWISAAGFSSLLSSFLSLQERLFGRMNILISPVKNINKSDFFSLACQTCRSSAPGKGRRHRKLIVPMGLTQSEPAYVVSQQSDTDEITKLGVLDDTKPSGTIRVNEHARQSV